MVVRVRSGDDFENDGNDGGVGVEINCLGVDDNVLGRCVDYNDFCSGVDYNDFHSGAISVMVELFAHTFSLIGDDQADTLSHIDIIDTEFKCHISVCRV